MAQSARACLRGTARCFVQSSKKAVDPDGEIDMPTFRKSKDADHYFALTSIGGQVITFQLSQAGRDRLLAAGLKDGDRFHRGILADLYRDGDAFTLGSGVSPSAEDRRQLHFDFPDDSTSETVFPSCSQCASLEDLHLRAGREGTPQDSYLLCARCRMVTAVGQDVSIPLPLVSRPLLNRLVQLGFMKSPDAKVARYRDGLEMDFQKTWDELRKKKGIHQDTLFPRDSGPQRRLIE